MPDTPVTPATPEVPTEKPTLPISARIHTQIKSRIELSGPVVREGVVAELTQREIKKRTETVLSALELRKTLDKELNEARNSGKVAYGPDMKPLPKVYEKQQVEKINATEQKIGNLEKALEDALESGNYDKLNKLVGGGGKNPQPPAEE